MPLSSFFLLAAGLLPGAAHEQANWLYRELHETGVAVSPTIKVPLPDPTLKDGLDPKSQEDAIAALAGTDYSVEDFLRQSVVAPNILRFRDIDPSDKEAPAHGIDLWFVAYGSLETLTNKDFLKSWQNSQKEGSGHVLTEAELAKLKLKVKTGPNEEEAYGTATFAVLDRVQLTITTHSDWTRNEESFLVASKVDPTFENDPDIPNQWRWMEKDDQGRGQARTSPSLQGRRGVCENHAPEEARRSLAGGISRGLYGAPRLVLGGQPPSLQGAHRGPVASAGVPPRTGESPKDAAGLTIPQG